MNKPDRRRCPVCRQIPGTEGFCPDCFNGRNRTRMKDATGRWVLVFKTQEELQCNACEKQPK